MVTVNARLSALKESMENSVHLGLGCAPEGLKELPELGGFSSGATGSTALASSLVSLSAPSPPYMARGPSSSSKLQNACFQSRNTHVSSAWAGRAWSRPLTDLSGPLGSSVRCQMG